MVGLVRVTGRFVVLQVSIVARYRFVCRYSKPSTRRCTTTIAQVGTWGVVAVHPWMKYGSISACQEMREDDSGGWSQWENGDKYVGETAHRRKIATIDTIRPSIRGRCVDWELRSPFAVRVFARSPF